MDNNPNVKFYYVNQWWSDTVTLSSSSEATGFPDTNTQKRQRTKRWRSTGDTAEWIMIGGTAIPVDGVCIFGHNLTPAATVKVEANATDSWGSPSVSQAMTRTSIDRMNQYVHIFGSTQTYNFWRFTFADAANPDGYISIGVPWIGEMGYEPSNGVTDNAGPTLITNSIIMTGDGGQAAGVTRATYQGLTLPFNWIDDRSSFVNFFHAVDVTMPFVTQLMPWSGSTYATPEDWTHYGRLTQNPGLGGITQDFWRGEIQTVEEL